MLLGHLAFMTHRCWTVFMRKAIYLAAEVWRREYGQPETQAEVPASKITYQPPETGENVTMDGWSLVKRGEATVYVGPDGDEYDTLEYAHKAFEEAKSSTGNFAALTKSTRRHQRGLLRGAR